MPDYSAIVHGVYPLGGGSGFILANGGTLISSFLNARDIADPGTDEFVQLGPGSQVWILGYSLFALLLGAPTDSLGVELSLWTAYASTFSAIQTIVLPVYSIGFFDFSGRARIEAPAARWQIDNNCGQPITLSFQFWGKGN